MSHERKNEELQKVLLHFCFSLQIRDESPPKSSDGGEVGVGLRGQVTFELCPATVHPEGELLESFSPYRRLFLTAGLLLSSKVSSCSTASSRLDLLEKDVPSASTGILQSVGVDGPEHSLRRFIWSSSSSLCSWVFPLLCCYRLCRN